MKKILFGVVAAVSVALVGCGGGDPCGARSKCSAEPAPTESEITACRNASMSTAKCSSQSTALGNCLNSREVCASDNTTDGLATLAACSSEFAAVSSCQSMP